MQINWKRNLAVIWLSQFLSIMGFAFALPFAPYYIQELGVTDEAQLKLMVSLFAAAAPLSLAVFSPIWGAIGDRYGRRLMLLRANFGAMVLLLMMGSVRSVGALIALRLLQGVLTGTVTAAQTLVSVHTPQNKSGLALGALSAALFSGAMAGSFFGGVVADFYGYQIAFYAASGLLLAAGLLVLFGAREDFVKPKPTPKTARPFRLRLPDLGPCTPILLLISGMAFVRLFDRALLPLLVQQIHGSIDGAALRTGSLAAFVCVAGLIAGVTLGRLADRVSPPRIARWSAIGAGVFMILQGLAYQFPLLFAARFGMIYCAGGLDPVFQIWLAKTTPEERRGTVFGWAATAKAIGWMCAPLVSGVVASGFGIRSIYLVGGILFFLLVPAINAVVRRLGPAAPGLHG